MTTSSKCYKDKPIECWHAADVCQWYRDCGLFHFVNMPARELDGHGILELLRVKTLIESQGTNPTDWLKCVEQTFTVSPIIALKFSYAFHQLQEILIKRKKTLPPRGFSYGWLIHTIADSTFTPPFISTNLYASHNPKLTHLNAS